MCFLWCLVDALVSLKLLRYTRRKMKPSSIETLLHEVRDRLQCLPVAGSGSLGDVHRATCAPSFHPPLTIEFRTDSGTLASIAELDWHGSLVESEVEVPVEDARVLAQALRELSPGVLGSTQGVIRDGMPTLCEGHLHNTTYEFIEYTNDLSSPQARFIYLLLEAGHLQFEHEVCASRCADLIRYLAD